MSNSETKTCQNCKRDFTIESEDFEFYEKISVPPPTFCPECRLQRRFILRNERTLYKRKCNAPGHTEEIVSIYSKDSLVKVYDQQYWWSDEWDPMKYGRGYDWNKPFFQQFMELIKNTPRISLYNTKSINSEYCNHNVEDKNCYLCFSSAHNENCLYTTTNTMFNKDATDNFRLSNSELCYETINCAYCYRTFFSKDSEYCNESLFLNKCRNCTDCFAGINLRNKQHIIFNEVYTKENYIREIKKMDLGSFNYILKIKDNASKFYLNHINQFANLNQCSDVVGDVVNNSKNSNYCFYAHDVEDSKYIVLTAKGGTKNCYDVDHSYGGTEFNYEVMSVGESSRNIINSAKIAASYDIFYSESIRASSNLFGCIGLRNKQYCILNKQYTKEEYTSLVSRIMKHMDEMPYIDQKDRIYKYGEFFPSELSPFAYNETIAQEYFPLTKEAALEQGYRWKEPEEKQHAPTISWRDLPDNIKDVSDAIVNEAILCRAWDEDGEKAQMHNCTKVFRIIPQELAFYRKMNLPLPRFCPNSRHFHRIQQRNPLKLWHRKCMCQGAQTDADFTQIGAESQRISAFGQRESALPYINTANHFHGANHCPNEFETSYAPDRPEIVYCEQCYQSEVV